MPTDPPPFDTAPFRRLLLERRETVLREIAATEADSAPVVLDQTSVGRLSRMDAMQQQAMALAQRQRRQNEVAAIDAALRRIERGDYGVCVTCGEDIALPRLRNAPTVTTCIACAR